MLPSIGPFFARTAFVEVCGGVARPRPCSIPCPATIQLTTASGRSPISGLTRHWSAKSGGAGVQRTDPIVRI